MDVKVSVCMITYNHEKFIVQAIESVMMQQTNFNYELVIGEDCSTDTTRKIVLDFQKKYPDKIRPLLPEHNLGMTPNFVNTLAACRGEYIALLEGDDYWIDPCKLQKQADFMDTHLEYSTCFHDVKFYSQSDDRDLAIYPLILHKTSFTIEDIIAIDFIPNCSTLFRKKAFKGFPKWVYDLKMADWPLHTLNSQFGSIGYLKEVMAVYRIHDNGVWSGSTYYMRARSTIMFYEALNKHFDYKYNRVIRSALAERCYLFSYENARMYNIDEAKVYLKKAMVVNPLAIPLKKLFYKTVVFLIFLKIKVYLETN